MLLDNSVSVANQPVEFGSVAGRLDRVEVLIRGCPIGPTVWQRDIPESDLVR